MINLFLIIAIPASVYISKKIFGAWFNHVSLYAVSWGGSVILFNLNMINYYAVETETWLIIAAGWTAFTLGSITIHFVKPYLNSLRDEAHGPVQVADHSVLKAELRLLKRILWTLNIITFATTLYQWNIVIDKFGSLSNVLIFGNFLYSYRVSEGLPGSIPYVSSLALTGTLLAGVYTARAGRLKIVAMVPIIIVIMLEVASMGRAKLIMAGVLFFSGYYFFGKNKLQMDWRSPLVRFRKIGVLLLATALLIAGAEFVRSTRGVNERFRGTSQALDKLQGMSFITPSIYLYLTVHHGVLSQYLKHGGEKNFWGSNTFAPLYRILAKLGFDTHVETYQIKYRTPVSANTGTYLREFHADFGISGILIGPYILGLCTSFFWFKTKRDRSYFYLAFFSYFLVVIAMSLFYIATRSGDLLVCLIGSATLGHFIDKKLARYTCADEAVNRGR